MDVDGKEGYTLVKWVNEVYMNNDDNFWTESSLMDCSWYWKVLHKLKLKMKSRYMQGHYCLTSNGKYSKSLSYFVLIG